MGKLYASPPEPLSFGRSLERRAFLLRRNKGNLLVYSVGTLEDEVGATEALGGISRQYLNHRHEGAPSCDWVADTFGAPLHSNEKERSAIAERCRVSETFSGRSMLDDDFEIVPTPGHTPGATAFVWNDGQHRFLFTSDTLLLREGVWSVVVLGESDRDAYIDSLAIIKQLDFDVLVPSFATRCQHYDTVSSRAEAGRRIDAIIERLQHGENH